MAAITHFFQKANPQSPLVWPSLSLIQPITRGAANLDGNLRARFAQQYAGSVQHLLVCDRADEGSQAICRKVINESTTSQATLVLAAPTGEHSAIASKIAKLNAGLAQATGELICCIDDDIEAPADLLQRLVCHLQLAGVGAVFGLAHAVSWETPWSSMMSLFVNSSALPTYIPLTYLSDPVSITGHLFMLRSTDLQRVGSWEQMETRVDDDNDLGRRLIEKHLRLVQTPVIYRVHNQFGSWHAYERQIKRWFIMPRQSILPHLSNRQKLLSSLLSVGLILPLLSLGMAILHPTWQTWLNLLLVFLLFCGSLEWLRATYLQADFPRVAWLLTPITLWVTPLQMLWAMFLAKPVIDWRGQRLQIERGGAFQRVEE
ncbi:MAG: glycosyltransferase [Caldilineaceae bacterium]